MGKKKSDPAYQTPRDTPQETLSKILTVIVIFIIAVGGSAWMSGEIGILSKGKLESDARAGGSVPAGHTVTAAEGADLSAMLFYNAGDPADQPSLWVYENRTGFYGSVWNLRVRFGWFLDHSGYLETDETGILCLTDEEWDAAVYASLNEAGCIEAEYADGTRVALDPQSPFLLVTDSETLTVYDAAGNARTVEAG